MASGKERRKTTRFESNLFADLEDPNTGSSKGRAVVVDVSLSGFGLETELDLEQGQELVCHIEIPLRLRAKVVRRITPGQMKRYGMLIMGQGFFDKIILKKLLKGKKITKKII